MRKSFKERGFDLEITGEVTDIIYQNELNSYTVAEFETKEGDITIVGYLPFINVGDTLKLIRKNSYSSRLWRTIQGRNF